MNNVLTIQDCIDFAKYKNGKCLSLKYINNHTKLRWKCENGHIWLANFHNIKCGKWCPICSGKSKHTIIDCHLVAYLRDGKCLETAYIDCKHKMRWSCKNNHEWHATFDSIIRGSWCPDCSGNIKLSIHACRAVAAEKNGICLSEKYINNNTKYKWQCEFSHTWFATFSSIKSGTWCPICAGNATVCLKDCYELAKIKNGKFLSTDYKNAHTKYRWACVAGHTWLATYGNVYNGHWCPECSLHKTQKLLQSIVEEIFGYKAIANYRGFDWLKSKTNKLEIDIYVPELKLAIEYDGMQHFYPIEYFGGIACLISTQSRDKIKNQKIAEHPEDVMYFIRFNYQEPINKEYVTSKLIQNNIQIIKKEVL